MRIAQVMRLVPAPPIDRARVARKSVELGVLFFKTHRPASAIAWIVRATRTDPREFLVMLASFAARGRRKLIAIGSRLFRFAEH
jgi:hypothetical protein